MAKTKRWAGRRSCLSELQIGLAHRDHLTGATWQELGESVESSIDGRNFRYLFEARGYPVIRRDPGRVYPLSIIVPSDPAILAYIAGLIDGEGYISRIERTQRTGWTWRVGIANTSIELIDWLLAAVPGSARTQKRQRTIPKWPGERKAAYEWLVRGQLNIRDLLTAVRPFLVIKGDRADRAISELTIHLQRRDCPRELLAAADARIEWLQTLSNAEARKILFQCPEVQVA